MSNELRNTFTMEANTMNPDSTAPGTLLSVIGSQSTKADEIIREHEVLFHECDGINVQTI